VIQTLSESVDNEVPCTSQNTLETEFCEEDRIEPVEDVNTQTQDCFAFIMYANCVACLKKCYSKYF